MKIFENSLEGAEEMAQYFIESFGDISHYKILNDTDVSAIFLAGAPGAGKSEFLETIFCDLKKNFIVIDIDVYRNMFYGYNGENSSDFQFHSVKVADKILSFCFKNNLNFIFDGTFKSYSKVKQNLTQCEKQNRKVLITLIFQEPRISFYYTFLRKMEKKRNVPVDVFVDGFYNSIINVFQAITDFKNTELIIAAKKYKDIDQHKFQWQVHDNFKEITKFCRYFRLGYNQGIFVNRGKLKIDLEDFQNTLMVHFSSRRTWLSRIKLWLFKKISN